jgi:hypothetical protein
MSAHPEFDLQVKIHQWTRENIPHPHMFFSVDRSKAGGRFSHARQKSAGHVRGTPDTVLLFPGLPAITIELEAPGNKPEPEQIEVGAVIQNSGHLWGWCDSVEGYCALLRRFGVPLNPYAETKAQHHDLVLRGAAIKREEAKTGAPSKKRYAPRKVKPSAAKIRRVEAIRQRVMF